jgi:hypothetical protein
MMVVQSTAAPAPRRAGSPAVHVGRDQRALTLHERLSGSRTAALKPACVRCEVTLDRVTSGTILVLNKTNRD